LDKDVVIIVIIEFINNVEMPCHAYSNERTFQFEK